MKVKPTFENTRRGRLWWNYQDTNNWLLRIILINGKEYNFILRDLKKIENPFKFFTDKQGLVAYEDCSRISKTEYDMLKNIGTPSILNVGIRRIS
jgi:hypothetical protein